MVTVRPAETEDLSKLAQIFFDARVQAFPWCDPSSFRLGDFEDQTAGEIIYVAADALEGPRGFISVWEPDRFIHHLFVDPSHQKRGLGTLLMGSLRSWLPFPYRLKCLLRNGPARSFYLRSGWTDVSVSSDQWGEYALMEFRPPTGKNHAS